MGALKSPHVNPLFVTILMADLIMMNDTDMMTRERRSSPSSSPLTGEINKHYPFSWPEQTTYTMASNVVDER